MGLLRLSELVSCSESVDRPITGLALDSREVVNGDVFIALAGALQHGLVHVGQAINKGACAVIFDPDNNGQELAESWQSNKSVLVPMIAVDNLGLKLGDLAARFYGDPSQSLAVIGITGTNGKTSCSQFLSQVLDDCGIIGTLGWGEWGALNTTLNTTPDALATQKILAQLLQAKKRTVAMEVSSHGLAQGRVNAVAFTGAVFTNISRDHLDYHVTMEAYLQAKLALLKMPDLVFAVVNLDDDYSAQIIAAVPESVRLWQFSVKGKSAASGECVSAANIAHKANGMAFDVSWKGEVQRVHVPLYGDFNIENVLAVLTVMLAMGISLAEAVERLVNLQPVDGRMERFGSEGEPLIFVDYAHSPDALDKVLSSLRKHCAQALWVVFGCGGNRDTGKRALMGKIAEQWADHVVITDDNPRYENGLDIVNDILAGCGRAKIEVIQNREQAIQKVVASAAKNDCIVIAGKGHEQYQDIKGVKLPFSDRQVVIDALRKRGQQ
ncbi:MAG: UDP-N-acetylmuramoyl-L-alanyl-D-glutamate--2,6-diaminopimelate ligase [Methylobacter sp.]|nr:UDP-N-acetylmuramoyl-L-alanyl-D-glutamate--2,6-diaminopimelate ligase [Methylobacter sp.]MDP2426740.1 UDP-N-acetylmuramoyl-L-alanyl-D-glutamate--2,6-diaminopimelate ligase [Methylobacter sp.]MDP3054710.1 UDP-N-acetylmuramoyl-L-alanyl-D-glutamate--2,6-diaminopimelate ligase [Methylobacter sp.]MDP3361762.1 UDP-N-acetylmuramoyl-L-alanyl-D-glutamate--2,6-diaminopimelate ligase [Methylobacter sp.]